MGLSGVAFAQFVPPVLVGPFIIAMIDQWSRWKVLVFSDGIRLCLIAGLWLSTARVEMMATCVLLAADTAIAAVAEPARTALMPEMSSRSKGLFAFGGASLATAFTLAIGGLIGGTVLGFADMRWLLAVDALTFITSAALVFSTRNSITRRNIAAAPNSEASSLPERSVILLPLISMKAWLGITGASWVLFPILARAVGESSSSTCRVDAVWLGLLWLARGLGAGGVAAIMMWLPGAASFAASGRAFGAGFAATAAGYLALRASQSPTVVFSAIFVAHAGASLVWIVSNQWISRVTPESMMGRVFTIDLSVTYSISVLAAGAGAVYLKRGGTVGGLAGWMGVLMLFPTLLHITKVVSAAAVDGCSQ